MKLPCIVLFISLVGASVAQLTGSKPDSSCETNFECKLKYGEKCFCFKPENLRHGMCVCKQDINNDEQNECYNDSDCELKMGHAGHIHGRCGCHRNNYVDPKGHCGCL